MKNLSLGTKSRLPGFLVEAKLDMNIDIPGSKISKSMEKQQQKPRPPVNMRAAHILATALVVANARSKWRADRAMLPALATLPRYPTNHTQTHTPQQHTHALASQIAEWPAGCPTQHATHARKAHHHAATTSLSTLQHSAAKILRKSRASSAPVRRQHASPCSVALRSITASLSSPARAQPWHTSTRARTRAHLMPLA